jgi:hypothetical protein
MCLGINWHSKNKKKMGDPTPWLPKCFYVTPIIIQAERPSFLDQYCITLPDTALSGQKN